MQPETTGNGNNRSANLFVLNMIIVYAAWKAFAYYVHNSIGFIHDEWMKGIYFLGSVYAHVTSGVLNIFGEDTTHIGIAVFYPVLNKLIRVEDHCLAIPATIIFVGTIALFKGEWRNKLWYIPTGVFLIILINLSRLVFLCYTFAHFTRAFFDINHSLIYVVITYGLIFLMIVLWMRKFADRKVTGN